MPWVEKRRNGWIVRERKGGKVKSRYFDDEQEARYFARMGKRIPVTSAEIVQRLQEGMPSKKKLTPKLAEYARQLIETDDISQGSKDGYLATIRNHLEGTPLGDKRLADIDSDDVKAFWSKVTPRKVYERGGDGAKANVYRLLAKCFNAALLDGKIESSPLPRSRVKRPSKRRARPVDPMPIDQVEALAAAAGSERNRLAILIAGLCGLRGGEVGGLRVRDVDAAKCRLTVAQAVVRTRGGKAIGPPKTEKSERTITIPCSLSREIAQFVKGRPKSDLIFETEGGGLVDHVVANKWVQKAAKAVGDGPVNFHLLRHACVSLLIDSGANPRQVMEYVGHSDITVTLALYSHLFDASGADLADRMEARRADYLERIKDLGV